MFDRRVIRLANVAQLLAPSYALHMEGWKCIYLLVIAHYIPLGRITIYAHVMCVNFIDV